ncbi:AGAP007275-PA [Anopheles gambiae str. PEST]|uniref:AGAP007275-PA n=1 Tax=Anopheles gambiae TaxID=7165 RepID=A7URH9_ANOGA|nr:AGAP007275-PA [Anopheles gambiae str. PEST]
MNRLLLAFGLVCLLQGLSAEPRPEFALTGTVPASNRITAVKNDANTTATAIKALNATTVNSGYPGLIGTKTQIEKVITQFDTKAQAILAAYDTLLAANDGNVSGQFDAFVTTINATITYIATDASNVTAELGVFNYTGISDELTDAFERILTGLIDLRAKTATVQTGIQAAVNSAGSATVSADILRQYVPLRTMYDLLRAASNLRAYLPLVQYILTTTIENIAEADSYLMELETLLSTGVSTETGKYAEDIQKIANETIFQVVDGFAGENINTETASNEIVLSPNIGSAPRHSDLIAAATNLSALFTNATLMQQTNAMVAAFTNISTSLTSRIATLQAGFNVLNFPLFKQLVDTLMGNDEYGRYCYQKYKELGKGIFGQAFDSAWQCVDNEYARLEYLKTTLGFMIELLAYDYEDVIEQVKICDNLTSADNLNNCVSALSNFYTELFNETARKISTMYQLATDEAAASENRILICIELVYIQGTVLEPQKISDNLAICSRDGPKGSD